MPRPKPPLEERKRVSRARASCKASKTRCNGSIPCSACIGRGKESYCRISGFDGRRRTSGRTQPHEAVSDNHAPRSQATGVLAPSSVSIVLDAVPSTTESTPARPYISSGQLVAAEPELGKSHCSIADSETASSSFLQYLRETLRPYIGSTSFTEGARHELEHDDLEEIADKLNYGKILHVPTAENLLAQLQSWSQTLPTSLRKVSFTDDINPSAKASHKISSLKDTLWMGDLSAREKLSGALHVSCIYHFAVILITRPAYLLSRLRGRAPDQLIPNPDEASDVAIKNSTISKMAQVCVSAATHTATTCAAAYQHGYSFGNLCLLKAWVFGAGFILGFSKFAGELRKDIDEAFEQVNSILESIAIKSPQTGLYRDTLEALRESIAKWH